MCKVCKILFILFITGKTIYIIQLPQHFLKDNSITKTYFCGKSDYKQKFPQTIYLH